MSDCMPKESDFDIDFSKSKEVYAFEDPVIDDMLGSRWVKVFKDDIGRLVAANFKAPNDQTGRVFWVVDPDNGRIGRRGFIGS